MEGDQWSFKPIAKSVQVSLVIIVIVEKSFKTILVGREDVLPADLISEFQFPHYFLSKLWSLPNWVRGGQAITSNTFYNIVAIT